MKLLVRELVLREISGWKALDENIGRPHQLAKHEPAVGRFEIERDAALVRIERQPVQALTAAMMLVDRWPPARQISARRLDLDHVGAQIREDSPGQEAERTCHVEHTVRAQEHVRHISGLLSCSRQHLDPAFHP